MPLVSHEPRNRHHKHERESSGGECHTCPFRRIAEAALQELGNQNGASEQHNAQREREKDRGAEVSVLQQSDIHNRIVVVPLPQEECDKYGQSNAQTL